MRIGLQVVPLACLISALLFCADGCKNPGSPDTTNSNSTEQAPPGQIDPGDPANANLAPVSNSSDNTGMPKGEAAQSPAAAKEYETYSNYEDPYANQQSSLSDYDDYAEDQTPTQYAPDPPPPMPDYQQPPCPGDGYIWTPGYWEYASGQGYYWVPGAWVMAPYEGALWTPGWWGFTNGRYGWHQGYWGRHIGYYGGIAYGNGYDGFGYQGGYWKGDRFEVNRFDNNVNPSSVHYVYNYLVQRYNTSRVSYNGGQGGIQAQPRPEEVEALHERHNPPMTAQVQLAEQARGDRQNFANVNHGRPQMPVVNQPLQADRNVPAPQPVRYTPPASRLGNTPWQSGARPPQQTAQVSYHGVGPEPMAPRIQNLQLPQRQSGAQPKQVPYHDVGPEHMVPRIQNPTGPAAHGGPVRAPGNPQAQSRPPAPSRPAAQRSAPQHQQGRPQQQTPRSPE